MKLRLEVRPRGERDLGKNSSRVHVQVKSHANTPYRDSHYEAPSGDRVWLFGYIMVPDAYGPDDPSGPARRAYEAYRAGGIDQAAQLNGIFAVFVEDHSTGVVHVGSDKLGLFPIFYVRDGNGWLFNTEFAELWKGRDLELNAEVLQEFIVLGYPLGSRTFFKGIHRLNWSSKLTIRSDGQLTSGVTPGLSIFEDGSHRDEARALRENCEAFEATIGDMLKMSSHTLCMLSGGYDSRRIYLEMRRQGVSPPTYTLAEFAKNRDEPITIEEAVALELTKGSSAPHKSIPFLHGDHWMEAFNRRDELLGMQTNMHEWLIPLVDLVEEGVGTNFDGFAGDTLCNADIAVVSTKRACQWEDSEGIAAELAHAGFADYFAPEFHARIQTPLKQRVREEIERIPAGPHRIFLFEVIGRGRRSTALCPLLVLGARIGNLMPYVDDRILHSTLRTDPQWKDQVQFQKLAIEHMYPDYAGVPSSHSDYDEIPDSYKKRIDSSIPARYAGLPPALALSWAQIEHAVTHRPSPSREGLFSARGRAMLAAAKWSRRIRMHRWMPSIGEKFWPVAGLAHAERIFSLTK